VILVILPCSSDIPPYSFFDVNLLMIEELLFCPSMMQLTILLFLQDILIMLSELFLCLFRLRYLVIKVSSNSEVAEFIKDFNDSDTAEIVV
jgi:hypothetical protein